MHFAGKTAIVTGGAGGIGRATAERFLRDGANVLISDIDKVRGEAVAEELSHLGAIQFQTADVSKPADVENLVAFAIDHFGGVDILFNNAGVIHKADFFDVTAADFERVLAVNLTGAFLMGQAVARHLVEKVNRGGVPGSIVNVSSINAKVAVAHQVAYCISKGGVDQLTKVMALSLAPYGIRVNAIGPGSIDTDMLSLNSQDPEGVRLLLSRTPLGRFGLPKEMASIASFLASDDAAYITGQTVYADGGRLALNRTVPVRKST